MRITPTREQMAYLASIGVSKATIAQPGAMIAKLAEDTNSSSRRSGSRAIQWWAIFLVIIVLLLSLASLARAEETQPAGNDVVTPGSQVDSQDDYTTAERLDAIELEISKVREVLGRAVTMDQLSASRRQIIDIEKRLTMFRASLPGELSKDRERFARQIRDAQASLAELKTGMATLSATHSRQMEEMMALITSTTEKADAQTAEARHAGARLIDTEIEALRGDLAEQRKNFSRALIWFAVITVLGIGLLTTGRILMEKRIRQVEQNAISHLSETAAAYDDTPKPLPELAKGVGVAGKPTAEKKVNVEPTRPRPRPLPTPVEQMQTIIASANRFLHIRVKPMLPSGLWKIGLATNKGNVRSENQDYGLCFKTDGHDVLIVADGCGGVPHGQRAAYLAAISAAVSVVRAYGMAPRWHTPHVKDVAARAIMDAAHRLAVEGDKLNVTDIRGGLRTTLIVVVGNKREAGYAYIGDGGGCVVKASGEVNRFLDPQKASDLAMNVLAASLGPMMEGEPVTGVMNREAGDLLIVGTDGVFDRVENTFPKDVLRGCIQYKGDLQKSTEHIVEELASFQDSAGYICDDNLTLGIMGDGTNPKLTPGFWSPIDDTKAAPNDVTSTEAAACQKEGVS